MDNLCRNNLFIAPAEYKITPIYVTYTLHATVIKLADAPGNETYRQPVVLICKCNTPYVSAPTMSVALRSTLTLLEFVSEKVILTKSRKRPYKYNLEGYK